MHKSVTYMEEYLVSEWLGSQPYTDQDLALLPCCIDGFTALVYSITGLHYTQASRGKNN